MLSQSDKDFLTLEREQRAQAQSDISDISSQSEVEEDVGLLNRAAPHSGEVYICT